MYCSSILFSKLLSFYPSRPAVLVSRCSGHDPVTDEQLENMFHTVDVDNNGTWSIEEFVAGMKSNPEFVRILKLVGDGPCGHHSS